MAVNVTQKDKTLQEVIAWCEKHEPESMKRFPTRQMKAF